jgi:exocyst complex protein 7
LIGFWFDCVLKSQIRTHAIRKAHENIDRTLKAAEVILSQFDLLRQVCFTNLASDFTNMDRYK